MDDNDPVCAQDRSDAKRYRWLKEHGYTNEKNSGSGVIGDRIKARGVFRFWCSPSELDTFIDGEMLKPTKL